MLSVPFARRFAHKQNANNKRKLIITTALNVSRLIIINVHIESLMIHTILLVPAAITKDANTVRKISKTKSNSSAVPFASEKLIIVAIASLQARKFLSMNNRDKDLCLGNTHMYA